MITKEREFLRRDPRGKIERKESMSEMQLHTSENLESRAFNAYFRACERLGGTPAQPSNASGVVELDDKQYVVLRNCNGILAVYRVRNDGKLKGLKLWPAGID